MSGTPTKRILHVDDDPMILALSEKFLTTCGFDITVEKDSGKASQQAFDAFDLLIFDYMMPPPDGMALCHLAREQGYAGPILMLTSKDLDREKRRTFDDLEVQFMNKPFGPRLLIDRVRQCLAE